MSNDNDTNEHSGPDGADHHLHAEVVGDELVIRIGVATLAHACVEGCTGEVAGQVTDARGFAEDVVGALLDEAEDGSSRLTKLLDDAMEAAINDGSIHVASPEEIVHCETCERAVHEDDAHSVDDGWLCAKCYEDAVEAFKTARYRCPDASCGWTGLGPETERECGELPACPKCGETAEEVGATPDGEASES